VRSRNVRHWLRRLAFDNNLGALPGAVVEELVETLAAMACTSDDQAEVHVRAAAADGLIYLDMADADWRVIEIGPGGWRVSNTSPIRFRRPRGLLPLPEPVRGGQLDDLWNFLNLKDEADRRLYLAWKLHALRQGVPRPILLLAGPQGSAKTTFTRTARRFLDPNVTPLRSRPRTEHELAISASNALVLAFDNISSAGGWFSDALCRVSTGGGFSARQLYSDDDEVLLDFMRPVILTSVVDALTAPDALDRAVPLALPPIAEDCRRAETELRAAFDAAAPAIFGALLDALAAALRQLPEVCLESLPRMADYATFGVALERALGWPEGSFLEAYTRNRRDATALVLEDEVLVRYLHALLRACLSGRWEGNMTTLLQRLGELAGERQSGRQEWPKSPAHLSRRLLRLAPALHEHGIDVVISRVSGAKSGGARPRYVQLTLISGSAAEEAVTGDPVVTNLS
jgi:hypothetical protein